MTQEHGSKKRVVIIGGGPAGLTAGYELTKLEILPVVLEKENRVGGLARTEDYKGFYFDIGGHRFFTKVKEVQKMWHDVLGASFIRRQRLSRIYYDRRFFYYPLKPVNALLGLGVRRSFLIAASYLKWQFLPYPREDTFEEWVTNRFGKTLFQTFFKTYTEKVWGISCSELRAEWAAQRIKDLSLRTAVLSMFLKPKTTIKTLVEEFDYPRLGPGMMWNAVKAEIERRGGAVHLDCEVKQVRRTGNRIESVSVLRDGKEKVISGTDFISSMPLADFIAKLDPPPPSEIVRAAEKLTYRDFLTVCLIVNKPDLFPDNWIYIHDPDVKVGRIQNFKNWSSDMVPDSSKTSLGLEYFCTEGEPFWNRPDDELIEIGKRELQCIGLAQPSDVEDGCVVRVSRAYPVYDSSYREYLAVVREFTEWLENFQTIGRNGLHRYNNQDHAMLTGMLAARNLALGEKNDLWAVNTEPQYHEETLAETGMKEDEAAEILQEVLPSVFSRLDRRAFGSSVGIASGVLLFIATLWPAVRGGDMLRPSLQLLSQYFPGYSVSLWGSFAGLVYGFASGFVGGWVFAFLRNTLMLLALVIVHRRADWQILRRLSDYL